MTARTFYEFFAGGGMARCGLGPEWRCTFANDFDAKKVDSYAANWGRGEIVRGDVATIDAGQLPGTADLAWASFPCQDLSLAGNGAGLAGDRSGAFWLFWKLIETLDRQHRKPRTIVLENVCGLLTSRGGADFAAIGKALGRAGYRFGAVVVDAARFLPQSRPRLFIIALAADIPVGPAESRWPNPAWHTPSLVAAAAALPARLARQWIWFDPAEPAHRSHDLAAVIEDRPTDVAWHDDTVTARLIDMMSDINRRKVERALSQDARIVGTIYKRTRVEIVGRVQRAEVRFDNIAGCLRTPGGGSSRQTIIVVEHGRIRSRLMSARETARLMGLPDSYILPARYNDAYHLTGDGVAVPVVRFLAQSILEPALRSSRSVARDRVDAA